MNKDIYKFLANLLRLISYSILTLLFMFIFGISIVGNQYEDNYNASLIDKVERLKSINAPKIILVGNSNLAFGMDSEMLKDAMNMPVVNLGLHGGLGNAFHENIAKLNINSGDIIIICHSTYLDDNRISDIELCWITLEYHRDLWSILRPGEYLDMVMAFPKYWLKSLVRRVFSMKTKTIPTAYSREAFNKYGDIVIKPDTKFESKVFRNQKVPEVNNTCTERLNAFNSYAEKKGATLLIAGYPIGYGKYSPPDEEYDKFQIKLVEELDCDVISDFRDYFMPYSYFYDSTLHLNEEGTRIRTQQLIKDIKRWQKDRK